MQGRAYEALQGFLQTPGIEELRDESRQAMIDEFWTEANELIAGRQAELSARRMAMYI